MLDLDLVKQHCRIDDDDNDTLLEYYIKAAALKVEHYTGRAITARSETMSYDYFGISCLRSKLRPLEDVVSIVYTDTDGEIQTLDPSQYRIVGDRIYPSQSRTFPRTLMNSEVIVTANVGEEFEEVPADLIAAQFLMISHLYNNRDAVEVGTTVLTLPMGFEALCGAYRTEMV